MRLQLSHAKTWFAALREKLLKIEYFTRYQHYFTIGIILLFLWLAWTGYKKILEYTTSLNGTPTPVIATMAFQKKVAVEITGNGSVQPYATVAIKPRVDGIIDKISFKEGQDLHINDLLFTIDPRPFQVQLQQAQANLARDKVQLGNAQRDLERYEKLIKKGYVSQESYDASRSAAASQAAVVQADEAAVASAQLQLEYCYIRSPINGRSGQILVQQGNLVKTSESRTLVVINQVDPIAVTFSLPEQYLPQLQQRTAAGPVSIVATPPSKSFSEVGELTFIDNAIDSSTGTFQLKANFKNTKRTLWPGQFVNVKLVLYEIQNAVVVPPQAIQIGQKGPYVFVISPQHIAELRPLVVGPSVKEGTVIEKGLKAGERVVIDGQFRLTSGKKVEMLQASPPATTVADTMDDNVE